MWLGGKNLHRAVRKNQIYLGPGLVFLASLNFAPLVRYKQRYKHL